MIYYLYFTDNCTRIMFVADPQILGETFDTNFYNPLAILDSDRYILYTLINWFLT